MENDIAGDAEYIRKFNIGYSLAKSMPELSEKISQVKWQSPSYQAMQAGRNQFLSEFTPEKFPRWLTRSHDRSQIRQFGKGKDKSNEPEM